MTDKKILSIRTEGDFGADFFAPAEELRVAAVTPFTTIDFPGKLSAVVFVQGCPWRCGYCQNVWMQPRELAEGHETWQRVTALLSKRRGLLDGVVFSGYAGEGVNEALSDLLCGKANFGGKLTETFPLSLEDTYKGGRTSDGMTDLYDDGIFVGYRYYDKEKKEVLFPFGFGLSYAKFEYGDLRIEKTGESDYDIVYNVTNVSEAAGQEISQVYVKDVLATARRPEKELKGFSKDMIAPHETKTVRVHLDISAFAYYNVSLGKWYAENGAFEIFVGGSSRNLPLKGKLYLELPEDTQYSVR